MGGSFAGGSRAVHQRAAHLFAPFLLPHFRLLQELEFLLNLLGGSSKGDSPVSTVTIDSLHTAAPFPGGSATKFSSVQVLHFGFEQEMMKYQLPYHPRKKDSIRRLLRYELIREIFRGASSSGRHRCNAGSLFSHWRRFLFNFYSNSCFVLLERVLLHWQHLLQALPLLPIIHPIHCFHYIVTSHFPVLDPPSPIHFPVQRQQSPFP